MVGYGLCLQPTFLHLLVSAVLLFSAFLMNCYCICEAFEPESVQCFENIGWLVGEPKFVCIVIFLEVVFNNAKTGMDFS